MIPTKSNTVTCAERRVRIGHWRHWSTGVDEVGGLSHVFRCHRPSSPSGQPRQDKSGHRDDGPKFDHGVLAVLVHHDSTRAAMCVPLRPLSVPMRMPIQRQFTLSPKDSS